MKTYHPLTATIAVLLCGLAGSQEPPVKRIPSGFGAVQGRVIDERGKPLRGAKVYAGAVDVKNVPIGKLRFAITNDQGEFILGQVVPGVHLIFAFKEEALYPDTGAAALATDLGALPRVRVQEGRLTRGVKVQLTKGGKLRGTVLDSRTGQPLVNSRIRLSRVDDPRLFISTGPDEGARFEFVIPSKRFRVEVFAPGYKTWTSDEHGGAIFLQPGSTKEIGIRLVRIGDATPK